MGYCYYRPIDERPNDSSSIALESIAAIELLVGAAIIEESLLLFENFFSCCLLTYWLLMFSVPKKAARILS